MKNESTPLSHRHRRRLSASRNDHFRIDLSTHLVRREQPSQARSSNSRSLRSGVNGDDEIPHPSRGGCRSGSQHIGGLVWHDGATGGPDAKWIACMAGSQSIEPLPRSPYAISPYCFQLGHCVSCNAERHRLLIGYASALGNDRTGRNSCNSLFACTGNQCEHR